MKVLAICNDRLSSLASLQLQLRLPLWQWSLEPGLGALLEESRKHPVTPLDSLFGTVYPFELFPNFLGGFPRGLSWSFFSHPGLSSPRAGDTPAGWRRGPL